VTPRGTDWSLAALVALLAVTGGLTALAGSPGREWVFALHGAGGFALAGVLAFRGRRVWRRLRSPRRWRGLARFQWVKWVTRIEVADGPDPGAAASTVWSSFTPEGRGAA
jgi:hypothetical protein